MLFRSFAFLATATIVAGQALDPSVPACGQTCYTNVKNQAGTYGCAADDMVCLCGVADFKNGVEGCAKEACPADIAGTVLPAVNNLCAVALAPPAPAEPTTPSPAPAVPSTTSTPPPADTPTSTPIPSSTSTTEIPTAVSSTTTSSTLETSVTPAVSTSSSSTASSSSTGTVAAKPTASTTSSTSGAEESSAPEKEDSDEEPAGLPVAAKAGIGIGAGAAAIALLGMAVWAIMRNRQNQRDFSTKHMIKISDPIPMRGGGGGSGGFSSDHHYETGLSDLEMKSRRYEDMVPRAQPRQMV